MTAGRICNREVVFINREASVPEAARLMREHHVGDLIVIDEKKGRRNPVGILTDRDIVVEVIAADVQADAVTVGDIMSANPVIAREGDTLFDAIKVMRSAGVRRLPVVGNDGALAGIISVDDLIDLFAEQISDIAHLISNEQKHEENQRA